MAATCPVRDEARALVARNLRPTDRVLVTGATGWFGATMLALLDDLPADRLRAIASRARTVTVAGRPHEIHAWDAREVREFRPTVVLNFAFLTRDKEALLGPQEYAEANTRLTSLFLETAGLPGVRSALTVSSGAARQTPEGQDLPLGSYGRAKLAEEQASLALVEPERSVVVARAWSVSGGLVQRPHDYAFSDLILQSRTGRMVVTATGEVWRRYCGVDDYLAVCAARLLSGRSGVLDSGGPEVEMRGLAMVIADRFPGSRPDVVFQPPTGPALRYCSDGVTWHEACGELGFTPATLAEQVDAVQSSLP